MNIDNCHIAAGAFEGAMWGMPIDCLVALKTVSREWKDAAGKVVFARILDAVRRALPFVDERGLCDIRFCKRPFALSETHISTRHLASMLSVLQAWLDARSGASVGENCDFDVLLGEDVFYCDFTEEIDDARDRCVFTLHLLLKCWETVDERERMDACYPANAPCIKMCIISVMLRYIAHVVGRVYPELLQTKVFSSLLMYRMEDAQYHLVENARKYPEGLRRHAFASIKAVEERLAELGVDDEGAWL